MKNFKFKAANRTEFGKGFARRIRSAGKVPAVLYSKGDKAVHITLPSHELALSLKSRNALYEIELDGKTTLAIVQDAQRDAVGTVLEHVDFLSVQKGAKIRTTVDIKIEGIVAPGMSYLQELQNITAKVDPTALPEYILGNVDGFEEGHNLFVRDLQIPDGVEILTDKDLPVAIVFEPKEEIIEQVETEYTETQEGETSTDEQTESGDDKKSDAQNSDS
jgi:large subunit ribosomal protein L25